MGSSVAWMSFDTEQQRRTQLMMAALTNQGTVDELGLGPVRDLIAGTIHPGLSVLHTRAKYLLFLPRIYGSLGGMSADALVKRGRTEEGRLAGRLVDYYGGDTVRGNGIIGRNTREHAKQPASVAYWPLLRDLRIRDGRGSVAQYCRELAEQHQQRSARSALHSEEDLESQLEHQWALLPDEDEFTGFELSRDEAVWLRERFLDREKGTLAANRSLVAHLLAHDQHTWVSGVGQMWDHPERRGFPAGAATAMWLGRDLDRVVHGARILYNHLCAERRPDHGTGRDDQLAKYEQAMEQWRARAAREFPAHDRLTDLDNWVRSRLHEVRAGSLALARWTQASAFLASWWRIATDAADLLHDPTAVDLIVKREDTMKPGRARLTHPDRLRAWTGDSGYSRFDYNWGVARRLLDDTHVGLGSDIVTLGAS